MRGCTRAHCRRIATFRQPLNSVRVFPSGGAVAAVPRRRLRARPRRGTQAARFLGIDGERPAEIDAIAVRRARCRRARGGRGCPGGRCPGRRRSGRAGPRRRSPRRPSRRPAARPATTSCTAGVAQATLTRTVRRPRRVATRPVAFLGAPDERVDDRAGDVPEHRADDLLQHVGRELVGELELDLARILGERVEPPFAVQVAERPVVEREDDRLRRPVDVVGGEVRVHAVVVDVDARGLAALVRLQDPWRRRTRAGTRDTARRRRRARTCPRRCTAPGPISSRSAWCNGGRIA